MITVVLFFVFISLTILIGVVTPVVREFKIASDNFDSKQSYFNAESGAEDMVYRIKNNMGSGTIGEDRVLFLSDSFVPIPTLLTDLGGGRKQIITTGEVNESERKVGLTLTTSTGVSFNYGVLVGQGGITLTGSGRVNGNVYANGPITGDSSAIITGTAISANGPIPSSDQTNGSGVPALNVNFGNSSSTEDIAQSFRVSSSNFLSKVQIFIKKVSTPGNVTVKIMNDSSGSIGTTVIATGTLSASSVTSSYGWVDVSFTASPFLESSKTYWLVIDSGVLSTKYYTIGATGGDGYTRGISKIGKLGKTMNNVVPTGSDYFFNIFIGGVEGSITGSSGSQWNQLHVGTVSGSAQAHTVNYTNAGGDIYCKSGTGNNKDCIDQPDPTYISYPVSEANIAEWKTDASSGGTYSGNYAVGWAGATIGPKIITGNLTISGGGTLVVSGTVWVKGNLSLSGGGLIKLAPSYGTNDGVVVVDGTVTISGGGHADGSGVEGSYLMLLSLSESLTNAISVSGGAGAVIVYAPYGAISVVGGASLKEATGYRLLIDGGSTITYESGLTNNNFSSGPSGSWSIDEWEESE